MSILAFTASLLESTAAKLRHLDRAPASVANPKHQVGQDRQVITKAPIKKPIAPAHKPDNDYPLGYWRCTHADRAPFNEFIVGEIYECKRMSSASLRIAPWKDSAWAPYWSGGDRRFCYPATDLDFEYIGTKLPAGEKAITQPPKHIRDRMRPDLFRS